MVIDIFPLGRSLNRRTRFLASKTAGEDALGKADRFIRWVERETQGLIFKRSRREAYVHSRWIVWYILRQWDLSTFEIATFFGYDHTSVLYGLARVVVRPELMQKAGEIEQAFEAYEREQQSEPQPPVPTLPAQG